MKRLVIERSALKNNVNVVKEAVGRSYIYANLSCDAYGAGVVEMAKFLREEGIGRFAVDDPADAVALREAGLVDEEILMLRSLSDRKELEMLVEHDVVCTIGTLEAGMVLNALAAERATIAEVHLQVDCGMGFGGFPAEEPEKIFGVYRNMNNVAVSGIYTQLHSSDHVRGITEQLEAFNHVVEVLQGAGYETGTLHAAGSFALLHCDMSHLDAVRAGSILLGRCQRQKRDKLQVVGHGEAAISDVRWLPKGHTVAGRKLITLDRSTRVAVIPVGYQNGFGVMPPVYSVLDAIRRYWKNRNRSVRLGEQKVRVLGAIGEMETLLDVTDIRCAEGDMVHFEIDPRFARGFRREYR